MIVYPLLSIPGVRYDIEMSSIFTSHVPLCLINLADTVKRRTRYTSDPNPPRTSDDAACRNSYASYYPSNAAIDHLAVPLGTCKHLLADSRATYLSLLHSSRQHTIERKPYSIICSTSHDQPTFTSTKYMCTSAARRKASDTSGVPVHERVKAHVVEVGTDRLRRTEEVHPEETVVRPTLVILEGVNLLGEGREPGGACPNKTA